MPGNKTHVEHCEKLYGYGFEEIHRWMDGTVRSRGNNHREDRHDIEDTPEKAYTIFKDKVPDEYVQFIKDAVKDHVESDKRKSKQDSQKSSVSPLVEVPSEKELTEYTEKINRVLEEVE